MRSRTIMTSAAVLDARDLERALPVVSVPGPARRQEEARAVVRVDARSEQERNTRLRAMVDTHIDFVARVLRNSGTPHAEIDDEVQRTFIVAARRLDDIRPGAEKSFLFRIAFNLAAHARRTAARRREVAADQAPEQVERFATPEALTDQKRMRELLDGVL